MARERLPGQGGLRRVHGHVLRRQRGGRTSTEEGSLSVAAENMAWVKDVEGDFEFVDLFARYTEIVGLKIETVTRLEGGDGLLIVFEGGRYLRLTDEGQSCCEHRYMTCDDDLSGHE